MTPRTYSLDLCFAALMLALKVFPSSAGQIPESAPALRIDTSTSCKGCQIRVQRVLSLGALQDSFSVFGMPPVVRTNSRGEYLVIPKPATTIAVYDRTGRLTKTIGREGRGPGEFVRISQLVVDPTDSIVAVDGFGRRASVFDPAGRYIRTFPLSIANAMGFSSVRLPDGSFVVGGNIQTRERIGYPLHHVSATGILRRSFGSVIPTHDPADESTSFRKHAFSRGVLWTARIDRYVLESWDTSGVRLQSLLAVPSWFPQRTGSPFSPWGSVRPFPWITGLWVDKAGLIWVIAVRARADWKRSAGLEFDPARLREHYETLIEIIDPKVGRVMTRTRLSEYVEGVAADGVLYSARYNPEGDVVYDIWRVTLHR